MSVTVVFQQMTMIFILVIIGYISKRLKIVSNHAEKELSSLVVNVCNPALILSSIWDADTNISLGNLGQAVLLGLALYTVLVILGVLIPRLIRVAAKERNQYNLMTIFGNVGFIGYPVVNAVLGPNGIIYAVVFNVIFLLLVYTYGKMLVMQGSEKGEKTFRAKDLINIGSISCVVGIILYLTRLQVPVVITESIGYMGRATTFLSMFVVGLRLAETPLRETFGDIHSYLFVLVRQLIVPILIGFVLRPIIRDELMYGVTILIMAMPAANLPLMMLESAELDGSAVAKGIVVTTILSVMTIPLVVMFV